MVLWAFSGIGFTHTVSFITRTFLPCDQGALIYATYLHLLLLIWEISGLPQQQPIWSPCEFCWGILGSIHWEHQQQNKWKTMGAVTSERPCISNQFSDVFLEPLCHRTCDSFQFNFWCLVIGWRFVFLSEAESGRRTKAMLIFIHQFTPSALLRIWYFF